MQPKEHFKMDIANQNNEIRWDFISQAINYYKNNGFKYIEVPWIVSEKALKVTLPSDKTGLITQFGSLVGSAEQSFIQLIMNNKLNEGKYIAASPCFRDVIEDKWHSKYFFKVELINYVKKNELNDTIKMIMVALDFFKTLVDGSKLKVTPQKDGYDIELNNIEIGSYGIRKFEDKCWIYGTGLAEPRFSKALNG